VPRFAGNARVRASRFAHREKLAELSPAFRALVAVKDFSPNFNVPNEAKDGNFVTRDYQFK
jgi:hypothetical protein